MTNIPTQPNAPVLPFHREAAEEIAVLVSNTHKGAHNYTAIIARHHALASPAPEAVRAAELVELVARAIDGGAFHRYVPGDCLPRGHEMDETPDRANQIQEFRQRTAESSARKALAALHPYLRPTQPDDSRRLLWEALGGLESSKRDFILCAQIRQHLAKTP